ncbi:MAG TPA: serpin family protein [Chthoniobacterales bacterium]|nr:serpin family protein [Chthoniobacterales bacterium]
MRPFRNCGSLVVALAISVSSVQATDFSLAAKATNELGIDLYRQLARNQDNLCLSPYSIQNALAMTFAGADGDTRTEMARVLHFPREGDAIDESFAALQTSLAEMAKKTMTIAEQSKKGGGPSEPISLAIANRLFAQNDYQFREAFRQLVKKFYGAPFEPLDFKKDAEAARIHINSWVSDQTRERIHDLIPPHGVNATTRLALVNAIYLKAPWQNEFSDFFTKPKPFHVFGGAAVDVPTMRNVRPYRYAKENGFTAVALPYSGDELQFLILIPDQINGLHELESKLTADQLKQCAQLKTARDVDLELPKFKLEPPTIQLADNLMSLGMKTAFDDPQGSANFDKMAPRRPKDYLAISQVFHKTFIAVDEKGTEAAAATAVTMEVASAAVKKEQPIKLKVDRPFLYAIQHVPSGACLFIGRVTDPR